MCKASMTTTITAGSCCGERESERHCRPEMLGQRELAGVVPVSKAWGWLREMPVLLIDRRRG